MILADSSFWISIEHGRIRLEDYLPSDQSVATCPTVMLEVLRGTRNAARYETARAMLLETDLLDSPTPRTRFEHAAQIYLKCRSAGITPDVPDCLIAACALHYGVPVLSQDPDFDMIARVIPELKIFSPSSGSRS